MTPHQVERVAEVLERTAEEIRASFMLRGKWINDPWMREAKRDHDECLALAVAARKMLDRYRHTHRRSHDARI